MNLRKIDSIPFFEWIDLLRQKSLNIAATKMLWRKNIFAICEQLRFSVPISFHDFCQRHEKGGCAGFYLNSLKYQYKLGNAIGQGDDAVG